MAIGKGKRRRIKDVVALMFIVFFFLLAIEFVIVGIPTNMKYFIEVLGILVICVLAVDVGIIYSETKHKERNIRQVGKHLHGFFSAFLNFKTSKRKPLEITQDMME